jgi:hypothetical protein
MLSSRPEP